MGPKMDHYSGPSCLTLLSKWSRAKSVLNCSSEIISTTRVMQLCSDAVLLLVVEVVLC